MKKQKEIKQSIKISKAEFQKIHKKWTVYFGFSPFFVYAKRKKITYINVTLVFLLF